MTAGGRGQSVSPGVVRDEDGTLELRSPGVGSWWHPPRPGALVGPGSGLGTLWRLGRALPLCVPEGVAGRVIEVPDRRLVEVAWGDRLLRLAPLSAQAGQAIAGLPVPGTAQGGEDVPAGCHVVRAPTAGVFYQRPRPDAAPFVTVGAQVEPGQPIGLVEVMKTFNQILYEGPDARGRAEVVEQRADDGADVRGGQVLVVLRAR